MARGCCANGTKVPEDGGKPLETRGLRGEQPVVDREHRELEPVGDAELVEDVRQVMLDRVLGESELLRDIAVGATLDDRSKRRKTNGRPSASSGEFASLTWK